MERIKLEQSLKTLVNEVEKTGFKPFNNDTFWNIFQNLFPELKRDYLSMNKDELYKCFGESCLSIGQEKVRGKKYEYSFLETDKKVLFEKIDKYLDEKYRDIYKKREKYHVHLRQKKMETIYYYLSEMPVINVDFSKKYNMPAPSEAECINYCKKLCGIDIKIEFEKSGCNRIKNFVSDLPKEKVLEMFLKKYTELYGGSISTHKEVEVVEESVKEESRINFPDIFLSRLHRNIDDFDYNVTIRILSAMVNNRKTAINVDDAFYELKKCGIDCSGLNFREWCSKETSHFRCANNQIQVKPGDYCNTVLGVKPSTILGIRPSVNISSKKEELEAKIEEIFYVATQDTLDETEYIKFEKKLCGVLNVYKVKVDFKSTASILSAYNLSITLTQDNILEEKIFDKVINTVKDSIEAFIE